MDGGSNLELQEASIVNIAETPATEANGSSKDDVLQSIDPVSSEDVIPVEIMLATRRERYFWLPHVLWKITPGFLTAVFALVAPLGIQTTAVEEDTGRIVEDADCVTEPLSWRLFFLFTYWVSLSVMIVSLTFACLHHAKRKWPAVPWLQRYEHAILRRRRCVDIVMIMSCLGCSVLGFLVYLNSLSMELRSCRDWETMFMILLPLPVTQAIFIRYSGRILNMILVLCFCRPRRGMDDILEKRARELRMAQDDEEVHSDDAPAELANGSSGAQTGAPAVDKAADKAGSKSANDAFYAAVKRLARDPDTLEMDAERLKGLMCELASQSASGLLPPQHNNVPDLPSSMGAYGPRAPKYEDLTKVGLLGCGGFAAVELYSHESEAGGVLGYALKKISKGFTVKAGMFSDLCVEKLVLTLARSPFIVRFHGSYNQPSEVVLVVEALLGGEMYSTYNRLKLHGSAPHARYYCASIAMALRHLHGMHILCRGVKPEDCVLDASGRLKMVDMGIAKLLVDRTYTTCGTPDYFAPEVIASTGHSFGYDWWALGCVAYEAMAGAPPFEAAYPMQIYSKVMKGIEKVKFAEAVNGPVKSFVMALCNKEPEKRLPMLQDGWEKFQKHPWFDGFDWLALEMQTDTPPYVPTVDGPCDLQNVSAKDEDRPRSVDLAEEAGASCEWESEFG